MELLRQILLVIHILGFAALIGGLLVQAGSPERVVNGAMRDGVGTAFLAGIALVGVLEADDQSINYTKIAVKGLIGLVLLILVMANTRKERIPQGLWAGLLLLSVANVCVAVLWSSAHAS
jgi:heme A synthase